MAEKPFFIVGSPRSGTTLLRFILSSHPRLYVPDETGFLPFLGKFGGRQLSQIEVGQLLARVGRLNRQWQGVVTDLPVFYSTLPSSDLRGVLDALYRLKIFPFGASRWGDKTPPYVQYIPQIAAIFPDAQFIHVVRDGRDASLSAFKKWGGQKRYMDIYYLLKSWVRNINAGDVACKKLPPKQFIEIKYETLVKEPENVVRKVTAFLGESFIPEMLEQTQLASQVGGGLDDHVEPQSPIHNESVFRWRGEFSSYEKKLANVTAGPALRRHGYEIPNMARMTAVERLRTQAFAAKFLAYNTSRTILYRLGIYTLNRNRRA